MEVFFALSIHYLYRFQISHINLDSLKFAKLGIIIVNKFGFKP